MTLHDFRAALFASTVASLTATVATLAFGGRLVPGIWQTLVVSLSYAVPISILAQVFVRPAVRWIGRPGPRLVLALSVAMLLAAAVGSLIGGALTQMTRVASASDFWATYRQMLRTTSVLVLVCGFAAQFYEKVTMELRDARLRLKEQELQRERMMKEAVSARLASLEARVHPHFLFNALNSVSELISVDPARAERTLEQLGDLLRRSLGQAGRPSIQLDEEIAIVRDYLAIEQQRFGSRLKYSIDVPDDARTCKLPAFALQAIVENAVKHAVAASERGGRVDVVASRDHRGWHLTVRDTGPGFDLSQVPPDRGIAMVVGRLESLLGPAAGLEVEQAQGGARVTVHIPATTDQVTAP